MNKINDILNTLSESRSNTVLIKNMHSKIQNIPGGALNAWKKFKGYNESDKIICARCNLKEAEHGGHVVKADPNASKEWYIIPLCMPCNEKRDETPFKVDVDDLVAVVDL